MSTLAKTVCITGASAGIGAATAQIFAENGYSLVLGARRLGQLKLMASTLHKLGAPKVLPLALDITDRQSVKDFADKTLEFSSGKLDILINNAGLALGTGKVADSKWDDWTTMLDTNVMGVLRLTREILPHMIAAKHGHIINMGSIAGRTVYEGGSVYTASKHALRAITKTLRLELNGTGIRVSSIDPGMVETEFSEVRLGDKQAAKNVYRGMNPLVARDIAECIYFAASRPAHVNIDEILVMPTDQAEVYKVHRRT